MRTGIQPGITRRLVLRAQSLSGGYWVLKIKEIAVFIYLFSSFGRNYWINEHTKLELRQN